MTILAATLVALSAFSFAFPLPLTLETDLNEAKALFFDRKYEESRAKWAEIALAPGPNSEAASYWIARCSESLGETERAFREYGVFLDLPPTDTRLAEEAEISRVGLATKLTRAGKPGFLTAVIRSLGDDRAPVRYFGALQVGSLPNLVDARKATPVLREIVSASKDADIVERAKLQLLRLEPRSLAKAPPAPPRPSGYAQARLAQIRGERTRGSGPPPAHPHQQGREADRGGDRALLPRRVRLWIATRFGEAQPRGQGLRRRWLLEAAPLTEHPGDRVDRRRGRRDDRGLGRVAAFREGKIGGAAYAP
jgi:hypothetical protein